MNDEILRLVDTIHRSKEIEKEIIFLGIEAALLSAVKKKLGESETIEVSIDRRTGETKVRDGEQEIDIEDLGRLAALSGKQVLFQKIREAERDRIFEEYSEKVGKLVTGVVQRMEGPNMIVNLGKVEGFLPRSEQVPGERFKVGERIKVLVKDLRKNANRVKIVLSRTSPDLVRNLFELEVPEIADKVIEIKEIAREPGYRTKIAVTTHDSNVDCVGACVGVRGSRIKNIVDELFGEKIDIVRWNESIEVLIMNALKPAEISSMDLDFEQSKAIVYVRPDQQSLAIGRRGQNVRLASKLSEWELDVVSVSEEELEKLRREDISQEDEEPEEEVEVAAAAAAEPAPESEAGGDAESAPPGEEPPAAGEAAPSEEAPPEGEEPSEDAEPRGALEPGGEASRAAAATEVAPSPAEPGAEPLSGTEAEAPGEEEGSLSKPVVDSEAVSGAGAVEAGEKSPFDPPSNEEATPEERRALAEAAEAEAEAEPESDEAETAEGDEMNEREDDRAESDEAGLVEPQKSPATETSGEPREAGSER